MSTAVVPVLRTSTQSPGEPPLDSTSLILRSDTSADAGCASARQPITIAIATRHSFVTLEASVRGSTGASLSDRRRGYVTSLLTRQRAGRAEDLDAGLGGGLAQELRVDGAPVRRQLVGRGGVGD